MPKPTAQEPATETQWNELVQRHQTGIWRYLRALGAEPQAAEELLQETFVVAWQRGLVDHGEQPVATFLQRTARHLYLKHCRARGRHNESLVEFVDRLWQRDCAEDQGQSWLAALRECLQQLDGRARTAMHLCYGAETARGDRDQIAQTLGMRANGLKTLLQRTRALLRTCIEHKLEAER